MYLAHLSHTCIHTCICTYIPARIHSHSPTHELWRSKRSSLSIKVVAQVHSVLSSSSPQWSHSNSIGTCVTSWHQSWLEYNGEATTKCRRWLSKQSNLDGWIFKQMSKHATKCRVTFQTWMNLWERWAMFWQGWFGLMDLRGPNLPGSWFLSNWDGQGQLKMPHRLQPYLLSSEWQHAQ